MQEQSKQGSSSASFVPQRLGYIFRTKQRKPEIDFYTYKKLVRPYQTYNEQLAQRAKDIQALKDDNDYQRFSELAEDNQSRILAQSRQQSYDPLMHLIESKKNKKGTREKIYTKWTEVEEHINGDKFPEFVVRDDKGFIQSADGLRIIVPIKRHRVTKYFRENPSKAECQEKQYKQWKEDKSVKGYKHFIKHYLSPFLKERRHTVAQVYSVNGGKIWKEVIAPCISQLVKVSKEII
ncbi:MAG: hypothetical protein EZS28_003186 [Streblomastix strix]|uniref:Uncharacterized protein n=1 Tax=Streblomastix strix TaxID=222440 RepID=A0A5J4X1Z8_9EUKA|nr:MAG: hypothetical protein EZS28_003186 [Streblomastix strix]